MIDGAFGFGVSFPPGTVSSVSEECGAATVGQVAAGVSFASACTSGEGAYPQSRKACVTNMSEAHCEWQASQLYASVTG